MSIKKKLIKIKNYNFIIIAGYDCPPMSDMYNMVSTIAGGSITAAKSLIMNIVDVAINWCGGWHHANRYTYKLTQNLKNDDWYK